MNRTAQNQIPALLERYELKYQIPATLIDPISDYLSIYCSTDQYSEKSEDGFYTINSLYFDTPRLLFLRNRIEGSENRFNMRVRSYDSISGMPCFFEIKQKRDGIVRKFRTAVSDENWPNLFEAAGRGPDSIRCGEERSHIELFYRTACSYRATPKVLSRYRRKAYISDVDEYARATFDRDLSFQAEEGYTIVPDESRMMDCCRETVFDPGCGIILELKCHAALIPQWMLDLIRYFNLRRIGFSKYYVSAVHALSPSVFSLLVREPAGDRVY